MQPRKAPQNANGNIHAAVSSAPEAAQSQRVQAFVGEAMAAIRSARAFLHDAIAAACDLAADGQPMSLEMRDIRLAAANAAWQSAKAVDLMYHAGGGSAIHSTSPLQRCFRDVHAITQHVLANQSVFEQAGAGYLGVENRDAHLDNADGSLIALRSGDNRFEVQRVLARLV
jgi:alkylation response protein AidB-like acyl-CoA dehydrogenase